MISNKNATKLKKKESKRLFQNWKKANDEDRDD